MTWQYSQITNTRDKETDTDRFAEDRSYPCDTENQNKIDGYRKSKQYNHAQSAKENESENIKKEEKADPQKRTKQEATFAVLA